MTDREKAGLRGAVRTCIEEITHSTGTISRAFEYTVGGRLLTCRQTNPDGSEWLTTHTYDADGRPVRIAKGKVGESSSESLYTYDERGRITEDNDGKGTRTSYRHDQQGRKTAIKTFAPEVLERYRRGVITDSLWRGAERGIGVPTGGSVTTIYDERDLPIEMQILDNQGRIVTQFVRTYDANGRILEEHQALVNPALGMVDCQLARSASGMHKPSAEQRAELDDKRLETINRAMKLMMAGKNETGKWYTYDAQGWVIEVRDRNFAVETVTTTNYNEHGDKSEVRITRTDNMAFPAGVEYSIDEKGTPVPTEPVPDAPSLPKPVLEPNITEYRYEYDQHGNWTQETTVHRSGSNESSTVRRHILTYY